jgi:hypothetical protein
MQLRHLRRMLQGGQALRHPTYDALMITISAHQWMGREGQVGMSGWYCLLLCTVGGLMQAHHHALAGGQHGLKARCKVEAMALLNAGCSDASFCFGRGDMPLLRTLVVEVSSLPPQRGRDCRHVRMLAHSRGAAACTFTSCALRFLHPDTFKEDSSVSPASAGIAGSQPSTLHPSSRLYSVFGNCIQEPDLPSSRNTPLEMYVAPRPSSGTTPSLLDDDELSARLVCVMGPHTGLRAA